mmetsp:Transcript_60099/g.186478  ORF Transcript_60099/g.186478 Transcript_60099/m.186478 type:complete len:867 (+) Transcript_60099:48-2648(+)
MAMTAKHDEVEKTPGKHAQGAVEMIRNPVALMLFRSLVERPLVYLILWHIALALCFVISSRYEPLKHKPLHLPSFNNRLKGIQDSLKHDFSLGGGNSTFDGILIWNEESKDIRGSADYKLASEAVDSALNDIKNGPDTKHCKEMMWQGYSPLLPPFLAKRFMAADGSAAAVMVSHPCMAKIQQKLASIDRKFGGLRIAMGSPVAVTLASVNQVSSKMMHHMALCVPVMWILLWLNTGNMYRSATAFISLLCSFLGTRAATVIIKLFWENLNFSGPDQMIMFVELALCLDYCLFFWTRFAQERKKNPEPEYFQQAVLTTLKTSGAVIAVSVAVLVIGYVGMCFYPDQNTVGCLAGNIQLIIGINLLGFYSLVVPASLACQFPSLFDEQPGVDLSCCGFECKQLSELMAAAREVYTGCFNRLSFFITRMPWMILMPVLVYACFVPFLVELRNFKPNFDMFEASVSKTVVEYEAFQVMKSKFSVSQVEPVLVMLRAKHLGPSPVSDKTDAAALMQVHMRVQCPGCDPDSPRASLHEEMRTAAGVSMQHAFRAKACAYIEAIIEGTRGKEFQIGPGDVQSVWWNSNTTSCSRTPLVTNADGQPLVSADGAIQVLQLYPSVHGTSAGSQAMTRFFWNALEPQAKTVFDSQGQRYEFHAEHYSALATIMLMESKYAARAPWILAGLVIVICVVVGLLFSSVGLGVKMIVTVVVPIIAEFGFIIGIYQNGWLEWAGVARTDGLVWTHFYTGMGLLLGLAIDYDIFLFARVYERRMEGYDNISAVRMAITETGSVITVAGTMMCVSFFFVAKSDIYFISQVGMLYLFGVALDTYIVRTVLAPAILCLSESLNYWPGKVPPAKLTWDGDLTKLGR